VISDHPFKLHRPSISLSLAEQLQNGRTDVPDIVEFVEIFWFLLKLGNSNEHFAEGLHVFLDAI
jgi:hypothetical protein